MFKKATKGQSKLRLALIGPAGSGKTYTSLVIASKLGARVAVVDTEHGSASKYADLFAFDVLELASFHPQRYVEAIAAAGQAGYDVIVLDSLSHAWAGKDGALEIHDNAVAKSKSGNTFTAWREVTPHHNALIEAIIGAPLHVVGTMRSKTEYVVEEGGKKVRRVGLAPVQRDGLEYEFDVVGDLDQENTLVITKSRCPALTGQVVRKPGKPLAETLLQWLGTGEPRPANQPAPAPAKSPDNGTKRITPAMAKSLEEQLAAEKVDVKKFLAAFGVKAIVHLNPQQYSDAVKQLVRKKELVADCRKAFVNLDWTEAEIAAALEQRHIDSLETCTGQQASELLAELEHLVKLRDEEAMLAGEMGR